MGPYSVIRRCVCDDEIYPILRTSHDGPCGGHFADKRTILKILQLGYYCPTIFKYAREYVWSCDSFQRMGQPLQSDKIQLQTQIVVEPFEKWALYFVGLIKP